MLDFLKFLFKKGKKAEAHPQKRVCKNSESCRYRGTEKITVCEAEKPKCHDDTLTAEVSSEAVKETHMSEALPESETIAVAKESENVVESFAEEAVTVADETLEETINNESAPIETGKYLIKVSAKEIYTFSLKSPKGDTIVSSGEYTLKRSCVSGIQSVRKNGFTEYIEDQTVEKVEKKPNPKYEVYLSDNEKYRFRLKAPNGYVILDSQAFVSKKNCLRTIENVRKYCSSEEVEEMIKQAKTK